VTYSGFDGMDIGSHFITEDKQTLRRQLSKHRTQLVRSTSIFDRVPYMFPNASRFDSVRGERPGYPSKLRLTKSASPGSCVRTAADRTMASPKVRAPSGTFRIPGFNDQNFERKTAIGLVRNIGTRRYNH